MGEKYLAISITGHNTIYAYKNENYGKNDGKNHPMFRGNGVAVWVNEEKPKPAPEDVKGSDWEFIV